MYRPLFLYFSRALSITSCLMLCSLPVQGMNNNDISEHVDSKIERCASIPEIPFPQSHPNNTPIVIRGPVSECDLEDDQTDFDAVTSDALAYQRLISKNQKALDEKRCLQVEVEAAERACQMMLEEIAPEQKLQKEIEYLQQRKEVAEKQKRELEFVMVEAKRKRLRQLTVSHFIISPIPVIAHGYETVYNRFINGKLIFQSNQEEGVTVNTPKEFPFSQFDDTLNGEFDLSGLTVTVYNKIYKVSDYLRIKIGFRIEKENESKTTVWIVPKFVVDQSNSSFKSVSLSSDVGIFWSWGKHELTEYTYSTIQEFDQISNKNLAELILSIAQICSSPWWVVRGGGATAAQSVLIFPNTFKLFLIKF